MKNGASTALQVEERGAYCEFRHRVSKLNFGHATSSLIVGISKLVILLRHTPHSFQKYAVASAEIKMASEFSP